MKNKTSQQRRQKREEAKHKLYEQILKSLSLNTVVSKYGVTDVRWAMSKFVTSERTKDALNKKKAALEAALRDLEKKS